MLSSNHVTLVSLVKEQNKYYLNVFAVKELSLQLSLRYLQSFSRRPEWPLLGTWLCCQSVNQHLCNCLYL